MGLRYEDLTPAALRELRDRVRAMTVDERNALALRMAEAGASGTVFEWMHRGGWRPLSQQQGDGIVGGDLEEVEPLVARRRALRERKGKR